MKAIICLVLVAVSYAAASAVLSPLSDEFIDSINSKQSTWKAGRNFDANVPISHLRSLVGVLESPKEILKEKVIEVEAEVKIPEFFDARDEWSNCASISDIRDQAACGSCWAFGAVEAMSDRICIHSNGEKQVLVSAEDLLDCCGDSCGKGCQGGYLESAWEYWVKQGIVTGGNYGTTDGCKAYSIVPCAHHIVSTRPACSSVGGTPACVRQCDAGVARSYGSELTFGKSAYKVSKDVKQIQLEILKNGPVEASFKVYEDFYSYKSGVYQHTTGSYLGGHAIRILGWGVENDTPYWLVANSWNSDWGDNGYFKIIRGINHVGIEGGIVAGLPKL